MEAIVSQISLASWTLLPAWLGLQIYRLVYNILFHPLRGYPGPVAAKATTWWKTYIEVVRKESFTNTLTRLHKQYGMCTVYAHSLQDSPILGDVVRVGPNEVSPPKQNLDLGGLILAAPFCQSIGIQRYIQFGSTVG
jgi:hypothetical protein